MSPQVHLGRPPLPSHEQASQPELTEHTFKDNPAAHGGHNYRSKNDGNRTRSTTSDTERAQRDS